MIASICSGTCRAKMCSYTEATRAPKSLDSTESVSDEQLYSSRADILSFISLTGEPGDGKPKGSGGGIEGGLDGGKGETRVEERERGVGTRGRGRSGADVVLVFLFILTCHV